MGSPSTAADPLPSPEQRPDQGQGGHVAPRPPSLPCKSGLGLPSSSSPSRSSPSVSHQALPAQQTPSRPPPVRKRKKLPGGLHSPKSILKPAPPPQKPFSFRRDILQSLNTRLAQQGVNVQVPLPQGANLLGGVFKRLGEIAGAALAGPPPEPNPGDHHAGTAGHPSGQRSYNVSPAAASLQTVAARLQPSGAVQPQPAGMYAQSLASSPSTSRSSSMTDGLPSNVAASLSASSGLPVPSSSAKPLKRVQFTVSKMSVVYPISGAIAPADEDDTRKRMEALHRQAIKERKERPWTPQELEALYRQCCRIREEFPLKKMRLLFEEAAQKDPPSLKTLDLSFLPLDRQAIDPLADFLSVDFGLEKLLLENCGLTDDGLKALLHGLLISGTLSNFSMASNRKIKYQGWRYVAIFMRRARALRYLDLSENPINRASLEHITEAIRRPEEAVTKRPNGKGDEAASKDVGEDNSTPSPPLDDFDEESEPLMPPAALLRQGADEDKAPLTSAIISLRLENCGLKGQSLYLLGQALRTSDVKHISLRRNRINQMGAVALAIMLKDYPESLSVVEKERRNGLQRDSAEVEGGGERSGRLLSQGTSSAYRSYSPLPLDGPVITSSPAGGMTARRMAAADHSPFSEAIDIDLQLTRSEEGTIRTTKDPALTEAEAIALYQAKRAKRILAALPRVGSLVTLDLKSNDIQGGVAYLAQVLRKNRTLRVLNLSDNSIKIGGLVALAEALKYNSTLETLDLSHNPCSGPGLEGITTLRTAFALNSNLKRLFLNDTDLSSEGAIALAEFLPEARSLIHLDLTENFDIDIAGVMALAVSVKLNKSIRCLDLNIPPNDPDFARLSQEILQSCIRNTQAAQKKATQKGLKQPIAAPIYKSVVARAAKEKDERQKAMSATRAAEQSPTAEHNKLVEAAQECRLVLRDLLEGEQKRRNETTADQVPTEPLSREFVDDLVAQAQKLRARIQKAAGEMEEANLLAKALQINDELEDVTDRLMVFYREAAATVNPRSPTIASSRCDTSSPPPAGQSASSSFSIGDGDDEEEEEEREGDPPTSLSLVGLSLQGSDQQGTPGLVAEKEEEESSEQDAVPNSPREIKARSMVDEEGEIFRRARSLRVGAEEDEDDGDKEGDEGVASGRATGTSPSRSIGTASLSTSPIRTQEAGPSVHSPSVSTSLEGADGVPDPLRPTPLRHSSSASSSSVSSNSSSTGNSESAAAAAAAAVAAAMALVRDEGEHVEDLPGEELKRRLLQADVPVRSRGGHDDVERW